MQDKEWRRTKGLSLKQYCTRADRRAAPRWHVHTGVLVRRRAGGKHTSKAAVRRAQGDAGLHSGCQLRRCNEAPRSSAKKLATEIAGAKALERAR